MKSSTRRNWALAAAGGMLAGLAGCGSTTAPVVVPGAPNEDPVAAASAPPVASGAPSAQPAAVVQPAAAKMSCNANMNMKPAEPAPH